MENYEAFRKKIKNDIEQANNGVIAFDAYRNKATQYDPNIGWNPLADSQDVTTSVNADLIQARIQMQEAYANNTVCKTIIESVVSNTVGDGFNYSVNTGIKELDDALQTHIEEHFKSESIDADKERDLDDLLNAMIRGWAINGASYGFITADKEEYAGSYKTVLRLLDIVQVQTPHDKQDSRNTYGVEFDGMGKPSALWVATGNPKKPFTRKPWRDSEGNRLVVCLKRAPHERQQHDSPPLLTAYNAMLDLAVFRRQELRAAVNASSINVIATMPNVKEMEKTNSLKAGAATKVSPDSPKPTPVFPISPGGMLAIQSGSEIHQFELKRPIAGFDVFSTSILREICGTLSLSYEFVYKAFADSNFASSKQSIIQSLKEIRRLQKIAINKVIKPLLVVFINELVADGQVELPEGMTVQDLIRAVKIIPPKVDLLDLGREATAWIALLNAKLTSRETASQNLQLGDWYKTLEEIKREEAEQAALTEKEPQETLGEPGKPPGENSTRDG